MTFRCVRSCLQSDLGGHDPLQEALAEIERLRKELGETQAEVVQRQDDLGRLLHAAEAEVERLRSLMGVQRPTQEDLAKAICEAHGGSCGCYEEQTPFAKYCGEEQKEARAVSALLPQHTGQPQEGEDDKLSQIIAAKMKEPVFVEMQERDAANINWPRYLTVQKVGPTAVSDWIVRLLPSGREIHLRGDEWDAARTSPPPPVAESGWQEIETLPFKKHGTRVMGFDGVTVSEMWWTEATNPGFWVAHCYSGYTPTHWMPLPAPPRTAEKREVK